MFKPIYGSHISRRLKISEQSKQSKSKLINFNWLILRHALPLFTSLLNIVFAYDPVGYGLPYNYLMFTDSREQLVEVSCQLLCVALETNISINNNNNSNRDHSSEFLSSDEKSASDDATSNSNLFISYLSRIHRDEVILRAFQNLLFDYSYINSFINFFKGFQFYIERILSIVE